MRKFLRKALAGTVTLAMAAAYAVVPIAASAEIMPLVDGDTVKAEWKFDFGSADSTAEDGYTLVTPDTNFVANTGGDTQYGFLGTDEEDYKLTDRYDGWSTQKGQVIELAAGGGDGLNDAVGVVGAGGTGDNEGCDIYGNQADIYYPTRFAMKVDDNTYYRIKATVTTLDPEKDATVSLYTERKHPLYTEKSISAGETYTITFSVRVTPLYYEKSSPTGIIADEMLTVGVLGENSALASLEIQQVETIPTLWILGDSTVTDGNTTLPFFQLQNYTGYGTGFTKYLSRDIAVVNAGEGGLASSDSNHFGIVNSYIKEGDYLVFEYGHNESNTDTYKANLTKYYNMCNKVGAYCIVTSPAERINNWDSSTKQYVGALSGYATAGKEFVNEQIEDGATDIAYVELTQPSLDFINKIVAENDNDSNAIRYYYRTSSAGATDTTHFNDLGAENIAYKFFESAKTVDDETQAAVLSGILDDMTEETPNKVSAEITEGGLGGDAWPQYVVTTDEYYPCVIDDVTFDDDGVIESVTVTVRQSTLSFDHYGVVVITIYDEDGNEKGVIRATEQVDNSTNYGQQTITKFTGDTILTDSDTYTAVVVQADDDTKEVVEDGTVYSATYTPTNIEKYILLNEDKDGYEDFDYYEATYDGETTELVGKNDWEKAGSAGITTYLNETDDYKYVEITSDGAKTTDGVTSANQGSFYLAKALSESIDGVSGKYVISADMQYVSGGGMTFNLDTSWSSSKVDNIVSTELFTVGSNGAVTIDGTSAGTISASEFTNVKYVIDTDLGTATLTVGGNDSVTVDLDTYQTTDATAEFPVYTYFMFGGSKVEFDVKVANLTVAKLKDEKLPTYSATVKSMNDEMGTVSLTYETEETEEEVETQSLVSLAADDDPTITLDYKAAEATVTADKACTVTVISAAYDDDGALESVTTTPLTFTEAGSQTVEVIEESKVTVWDSLEGMKPLTVVTEDSAIQSQTEELTINTVVTATATANDGYVFMGWYDGSTLVSSETEYSFRLRDDIELTAKFVTEPTVADITSFSLTATETSIKAEAGATTTMKIVNPVDSAGTPVSAVTNADMIWSCTETGVTVDTAGVVTLGEDFSMGDDLTKTITISGTINDVTKTCIITVYDYEYYEDMSEETTNFDGTFLTIANKTAICFPAGSTTSTYTMSSAVSLDTDTTIKFDNVWSGSNTCGQLRTLNFKNSEGTTIFSMYYSWTVLYVDSENSVPALSSTKDVYSTVTVSIDVDTNVVTISAGGSSMTTTLVSNAGDIAGIDFVSASSVPGPTGDSYRALGISNITIIQ